MKKMFFRLAKLDLHAMINESLLGLLFPFLLLFYPLIFRNISQPLLKIMLLLILISCLGTMFRGFSFSFFINYARSLDLVLLYFSVKYFVVSCVFSAVMTLVFSCFMDIHIFYLFLSLIFVSIIILSGYFLLFFYFLKTTEPEPFSGVILLVTGLVTFNLIYYLFDIIGYWAIIPLIFVMFLYFNAIVPLFRIIVLKRFEIIMGKIL